MLVVAGLVGLGLGAVAMSPGKHATTRAGGSTQMAASAVADSAMVSAVEATDSLSFTAHRDNYLKLSQHTMKMYRIWDMIIEPNCDMVFEIDNYNASNTYVWNVSKTPEHDIPGYGVTVG